MPPSRSESYWLRLSVGIMLSVSNLFLLIAISTNRWAVTPDNRNYAGIWKSCNRQFCVSHSAIIHSKVLLVFFLIFNILTNIYVIFTLYAGEEDSKRLIGRVSLFNAALGFLGMLFASIYFGLAPDLGHFSYGFVLGWLSSCLVTISATVSLIHACVEPDKPSAVVANLPSTSIPANLVHGIDNSASTVQEKPMYGNDNPPPYPGTEEVPATVIVS
ncbi:epithelial membrane protein 1-like [Hyla sarda]|uniref:epithelial membrane protein 1-like n=1 Tax=Hyla sarda TaxID=327740 RepID=UPI0024C41560|nr:epithelial membrane protein 1-like [Hyla sarda]